MTLKEIVQERYELEMNSLSPQAKKIITSDFSDFSRIMAFHAHGPYGFHPFTSSVYLQQELYTFSDKIYTIYVNEQIKDWKRELLNDISSKKEMTLEVLIDNYLERSYKLILKIEDQFVRKIINNNCPRYYQALYFIKREKHINDFLRCSDSERKKIKLFFDRFEEIYKDIEVTYLHKKTETKESVLLTESVAPKTASKSRRTTPKSERTKSTKNHKSLNKPEKELVNDNNGKRSKNNVEENKDSSKNKIIVSDLNNSFKESLSPEFYNTPVFCLDELTMTATINYGCNGKISLGLSSSYVAPSFPFLSNFERDHVKYDPDEKYRKPIVSDRITRSAHRYKWFGVNGMDYIVSFKKYGIIAKCIDLFFGEYICYVPVEFEESNGINYALVKTSDDIITSTLTKRKDLINFLEKEDISLRDFKLKEITNKLYCLCDFYDSYELCDFLDLDTDLYDKDDVLIELQAAMSNKTIDEFLWDSYTVEEKNDYLMNKLTALRNKDAFLRFNIVKLNYLPYSKEVELSYLVHSEYSIEVYINVDIIYDDESITSYQHIKVDSYDDQFIYFQGKTRIKSDKDYLSIRLIRLTCSDE